ncbi:MATE family efflux transporter [Hoeflea sp. CAU 1731]
MSAPAKFVTGSTMRHVIVMAATGSVGLVSIFIVDALNLFYISLLGQSELAAVIGYAGTLIFFTVSISIGMSIAGTAITSRALGAEDRERARRLAGASLFFTGLTTTLFVSIAFPFLDVLVGMLGATGRTAELTVEYMRIVLPSLPVIAVGMSMAGLLRSTGDAKRAMFITLIGGAATAVLDPLFIFALDLGIHGAAISTVISRFTIVVAGYYFLRRTHDLLALPSLSVLSHALRPYLSVAGPAIMTQLATPVGNAFVTFEIASYGDSAVAGWAVVGRIIPVAFGALFAMSGAVGPILGQNYGAQRYDRLRSTMRNSYFLMTVYVAVMCVILALGRDQIAALFDATGEAGDLVRFFCLFVSFSFLFNGLLFVSNAAFNNLGYAFYSTLFNWGRSAGVIPLVWLGSRLYGAEGALAGFGLSGVIFGLGAAFTCLKVIDQIAKTGPPKPPHEPDIRFPPAANSPFTSGKAAT